MKIFKYAFFLFIFFMPFLAMGSSSKTIHLQVVVDPVIQTNYEQQLYDLISFYVKETTHLKITASKADYNLYVSFVRHGSGYKLVGNLSDSSKTLMQQRCFVFSFSHVIASLNKLLHPLLTPVGLKKDFLSKNQKLQILLVMQVSQRSKTNWEYVFKNTPEIFSRLFWNTSAYKKEFNLLPYKDIPFFQGENLSTHFAPFSDFITNLNQTYLDQNFSKNYSYHLTDVLQTVIDKENWTAKHKLALIFVSQSLEHENKARLKMLLRKASEKNISIGFVLTDSLQAEDEEAYKKFTPHVTALQYKKFYLMKDNSLKSFVFKLGSVYREKREGEVSPKPVFENVTFQKTTDNPNSMSEFLKSEGIPIHKTTSKSYISFKEMFDTFSKHYDKKAQFAYFKINGKTLLVKDIPAFELKKLVRGKSYNFMGNPFVYAEKVVVEGQSFHLLSHKPPSFLKADPEYIFALPFKYRVRGFSENSLWVFSGTYLGSSKA